MGERMSLKDAGLWTVAGMFAALAVGILFEVWKSNYYERAYWAGRSEGWKASLEHQQKLQRMKSRAVFDYEKN
jgi:hypothetical protein